MQGNSQVVAWSTATVGGISIDRSLLPSNSNPAELAKECNYISQQIVRGKGARPFGISSIVASICTSILFDRHEVYPISHLQPDFSCCFSLPVILGREGVSKTIQLPLDRDEMTSIIESAKTLKDTIEQVNENQ